MNPKHHALQYDYPTPPTVARFNTATDRDAYIAARPDCRRPITHPVSPQHPRPAPVHHGSGPQRCNPAAPRRSHLKPARLMGMFDTVTIRCPKCGHAEEVQTKSGPCEMGEWEIEDAPLSVLAGLKQNRTCESCRQGFIIVIQHVVTLRPDSRRKSREEEEDDEC